MSAPDQANGQSAGHCPGIPRHPILCYITDRRSLPLATSDDAHRLLLENIEQVARAGVDWVQLREKDASGKECELTITESIRRIARAGAPTRILINDRLDVALAGGAGGVHLSESGIPITEARSLIDEYFSEHGKRDFLIGVSCHSLGAALGAERGGADYIAFSPIFRTPSKANYGPPQGLERLAQICAAVKIPVLALGGVSAETAPSCLDAGAAGIGAIRLFQEEAASVPETVKALHAYVRRQVL